MLPCRVTRLLPVIPALLLAVTSLVCIFVPLIVALSVASPCFLAALSAFHLCRVVRVVAVVAAAAAGVAAPVTAVPTAVAGRGLATSAAACAVAATTRAVVFAGFFVATPAKAVAAVLVAAAAAASAGAVAAVRPTVAATASAGPRAIAVVGAAVSATGAAVAAAVAVLLAATMRAVACILVLLACAAHANRVKRQDDEQTEEDTIKAICKGKGPGEWFRLNPGPAHCKEVVQCTSAGLQQIRCPQGLVFDLVQQTCDWKAAVPNCDLTERPKLPKPLLVTDEPLCEGDSLACAEGTCIARELFCDGNSDCNDGSDENACDMGSDPNRAPPCDVEKCQLPSCFCSEDGTVIPGNLLPEDVPQMVMLTFNGAINNNNIELFNELFSNERVNPNGCPIKGTFFVSHKYTNYTAVQDFHNRGHEIAVFSITQNDAANFWTNASRTDWSNEMAGQRFIIEKFAAISDESVVGMRTPYLRVGGNNQFFMMFEQKFLYDSTITAPLSDIPIWPYTLLNQMPHACHGNAQKCPTRAFPVWEMVMNELDRREDPSVDDDLPGCAQVDSCSNIRTGEQFYRFLDHNFDRHYLTNRAPLSLNFHSAWLKKEENLDYLLLWIEEIQRAFPDTYFVTMTQVIEWMQNTPSSAETKDFDLWLSKCDEPVGFPCIKPGGNNCALHAEEVQGTFNMQTCQRCPTNFPWLSDPTGEGFL